jgi:hypothetical protein
MVVLILLVVVSSAVWVYSDAEKRDFSNHPFAKNTTQWVIGMLGLWIIAFPVYLVARDKVPLRGGPSALSPAAAAAPLADSSTAPGSIAPPGGTTSEVSPGESTPSAVSQRPPVSPRLMILVGVLLLVGVWSTGMFDHSLASAGLNARECGRNGFGVTFCGDELKQYNQKIEDAKAGFEKAAQDTQAELEQTSQDAQTEQAAYSACLTGPAEELESCIDGIGP